MGRRKRGKKFIRVIWSAGLSPVDLAKLRREVRRALSDPDYSLVTNYDLHWDDVRVDEQPGAVMVASAPGLGEKDMKALVTEVGRARRDPDYAIVENYPVSVRFVNRG